jgi:mono/diheme cytochrome c family protein
MLANRRAWQGRRMSFPWLALAAMAATPSCSRSSVDPPATAPAVAPATAPAPAPAPAPAATAAAQKPATDSLVASEDEYQGWRYYHLYCSRCHGEDVLGSAQAPDLRKSVATGGIGADSFFVLARDGSKENEEMPGFQDVLEDARIRQIHSYVLARSEKRLGFGRPRRAAPPPD